MADDVKDLLFEIGTEELPSWYVAGAANDLADLLSERLAAAGLPAAAVTAFGTPRRLAVVAQGVPVASAGKVEERRGPSAAIAFDEHGAPTRAAEAFATGAGGTTAELERRQTDKGEYVYLRREVGGESAMGLLPALLAGLVADLPAPRKMRWAAEPTPFIRPVTWLLARFGAETVGLHAAGLESGGASRGHRFLAPGEVAVKAPGDYRDTLRDAWVLVDPEERRRATLEACEALAAADGLRLDTAAGDGSALLAEITGLVEWPFPIVGTFEPGYLELPDAVLTTVMIKHQRFLPLRAADGRLAPNYIGVSNNRVADEALVRRGYDSVLDGRLHDAEFFWRSDRRKSLSQHAWALSGIAFQRDLGSMADKIARVAGGAEAMAGAVGLSAEDSAVLAQALPLFRADLATEMVNEFPELEGEMARAYALAEGLPEAVADALAGGVMPKGPEDPLPATEQGALLAVADRLDKLTGFFAIGKRPSGSADPFGLRRDALALLRVTAHRGWPVPLATFVEAAAGAYRDDSLSVDTGVQSEVLDFLRDRVEVLLLDHGFDTHLARAALSSSATVLGAFRRAALLRALLEREEFADLSALYKRAANLARKLEPADLSGTAADDAGVEVAVDPELFSEPQEAPLYAALDVGAAGVGALLEAAARLAPFDPAAVTDDDLRAALATQAAAVDAALAQVLSLKAPLDEFLDGVLVMAEDERLKRNRLALLAAVVAPLRRLGALELLAR